MRPPTIKAKKRHPMNPWYCWGVTSTPGRSAMGEGKYDPGHFGVKHTMGRILSGEELEARKRELMQPVEWKEEPGT